MDSFIIHLFLLACFITLFNIHHVRGMDNVVENSNYFYPTQCGLNFNQSYEIPPLRNNNYTLKFVLSTIRHGDRMPTAPCWPGLSQFFNCTLKFDFRSFNSGLNNIYGAASSATNNNRLFRREFLTQNDTLYGNCGAGQLTYKGFEQEKMNGKMYRKAYIDSGFLPQHYGSNTSNLFFLRADEKSRTQQSLEGVFEGFYPEEENNENVHFNLLDLDYDYLTPNTLICPRLAIYRGEYTNSTKYLEYQNEYILPLEEKLQVLFNYTSLPSVGKVFDCFKALLCHDLPIPEELSMFLYNETANTKNWMKHYEFTYPSVNTTSRLQIGFLLGEFRQFFIQKMKNETNVKFAFYSAHDETLTPILLALDAFGGEIVGTVAYASSLTFEMYQSSLSSSEYFIRTIFNGKELLLPFCDGNILCPWDMFNNRLLDLTPTEEDCSIYS